MKYTLIKSLVYKLEEKVKSFIKKYGSNSITYTKSDPYVDKKRKIWVVDINIEGKYQLEGYEFIASLEYVEETGKNLIKKISSDIIVPEEYVTRTECDHCNIKRFRKYTVLLRNTKTGEYIQVGKSCVKDFLGIDITKYAAYLSFWDSLEELQETTPERKGICEDNAYEVEEILAQTIEDVKCRGYISKKQSMETENPATSTRIWTMMNEIANIMTGELEVPKYQIKDSTKEEVKSLINWINNLENVEDNDYVRNLQILSSLKYVGNKHLGLLVSLVGFKLREDYKDKERKANKNNPSRYIGEIGDKLTLTAFPKVLTSYDGEWGTVYMYEFEEDNNKIIWKTTKVLDNEKEITLKGTIKEHALFKGIKQTIITHCRIVD